VLRLARRALPRGLGTGLVRGGAQAPACGGCPPAADAASVRSALPGRSAVALPVLLGDRPPDRVPRLLVLLLGKRVRLVEALVHRILCAQQVGSAHGV